MNMLALRWSMLLYILPCVLSAPTFVTDHHRVHLAPATMIQASSSTVNTLSPLPLHNWRPPLREHSPSPAKGASGDSKHQGSVATFLEIIGGTIAMAIILSVIRCITSYRCIPKRDHIAAVIDRHPTHREIDELEYRMSPSSDCKRSSLQEPPPPYFPRPPAYDILEETPPPSPVRSEFIQVDIACPPPSRTITSQRGTRPMLRNI
ncbi:uncharacterized protein BT62DRAFT_1074847 [Guyanagaster necrorhizus]|uniref:Uncharacterized protein n=1 Tax=Guyanagaster necrorhizus TaxID=856835 RepID=A0A9P7VV67_9AGAR|nr:uncharacterized protein BT62DRAFT_1074847 [Guyanagaster necrorhizus MCA 3950]KAG7447452.1 hypothetical protein BT62DRAFT_1074847 [Guyanagaster necrorhizus MCA 3950]